MSNENAYNYSTNNDDSTPIETEGNQQIDYLDKPDIEYKRGERPNSNHSKKSREGMIRTNGEMKRPPIKPYTSLGVGVSPMQKKIQIKSGNGDIMRRSGLSKQYLNINEKNCEKNEHINGENTNHSSQTVILQDHDNFQKRKSLKADIQNHSNSNSNNNINNNAHINGNINGKTNSKKSLQKTPKKKVISHDVCIGNSFEKKPMASCYTCFSKVIVSKLVTHPI